MNFKPHDYQTYAIDYIENHPVSAVLLDMGLGKTVISLTAIADLLFDSFLSHRVLVIAPLRVARDTWPAELKKWSHLKHLTFAVAVGAPAERKAAVLAGADITIINRENVQWLIEDSGMAFDFDTVVIDELSSFKNHQSKRFKALLKVRPRIKRIIGLTGTPSSNGLMDLWAEFRLLDMGQRLGRFITQYRNNYFMPDKRNGQIIYSYKPLPYAENAIYRQISDITISMKSTDYLQMPELISSQCEVQLSEGERERYEQLKAELVLHLSDEEITAANAASLTGKLVQLANGAIYNDSGDIVEFHDRKLDAWRQANPKIVEFWWAVDRAVMEAVKYKHTTSLYGLTFSCRSGMLFITLPSGRRLAYVKPRIGINKFGGECITYEGVGATKKWERLDSYGPKFVENIVQATARDILCYAMQTLRCCSIVMHIHDEVVIEAEPRMSLEAVCEQMGRTPPWAKGLLLRADGYATAFYKKD